MSNGGLNLTADMVAHGLVAISRRYAADPARVFESGYKGGGKVRICVGAALVDLSLRAGCGLGATRQVAEMLRLNPTALAPSGLKGRKVALLDVSVAAAAMTGVQVRRCLSQPEKSPSPPPPTDDMAEAQARAQRRFRAAQAKLQASSFDPKALTGGKTAKPAPKFQDDPTRVRHDELSAANNPTVAGEAARQALDDGRLVDACRDAGGFPIFHPTGPLRGQITPADRQTWSHG